MDVQRISNEPAFIVIELNRDNTNYKWQIKEWYRDNNTRSYYKMLYVDDYEIEYLQKINYKYTRVIVMDF